MCDGSAGQGSAHRLGLTENLVKAVSAAGRFRVCSGCGAKAFDAYTGRSLDAIHFVLQGGSRRRKPAIELELACVRCGRERLAHVPLDKEISKGWSRFLAAICLLDQPAWALEAHAATRITPSRRAPDAAPITVDESIEAILAVRRAATWGEVLAAIGVPSGEESG
jgi:hypothetical protein